MTTIAQKSSWPKGLAITSIVVAVCGVGLLAYGIATARAATPSNAVLPVYKHILEDTSGKKINVMMWEKDGIQCTSATVYYNGNHGISLSCVKK